MKKAITFAGLFFLAVVWFGGCSNMIDNGKQGLNNMTSTIQTGHIGH